MRLCFLGIHSYIPKRMFLGMTELPHKIPCQYNYATGFECINCHKRKIKINFAANDIKKAKELSAKWVGHEQD